MPASEQYQLVILGNGEAGKYLAWTMARKGIKTALVERKYIGGSCPNIACLPSKNIIHSAKVANCFWRSEEFGISKDNCRIEMPAVRERKRKMVNGLLELHFANFEKSGVEFVIGTGRFIARKTIEVTLPDGGARLLRGDNIVISTGSRAKIDAVPGLREANPLTHVEALELDHIPEHLLILGGGYVGLEFAQGMRRFGSKVTIIDRNECLVHREDQDVSEQLHQLIHEAGIEIVTGAKVKRIEGTSGQSVKVYATRNGGEDTLAGTHLLVALGRTPNTDGIGLEKSDVATTATGFVKVNERLETTTPGVWAVGDCAGSPHFTHIAFDDFRVVRDNLAGGNSVTTGRLVPFCIFTDPEVARVGLSETEATQRGIRYRLAKIPAAAVLRTRTFSETRGFLKALIDAESDQILGFTAVAANAGEMIAAVQVAMLAKLPYTGLRDAIFTHPTMSEGLIMLFASVPPAAVATVATRNEMHTH